MKQPTKRTNRKLSDDTKKKMSIAKKGSANPRWHKKLSPETRKKISDSLKKYWNGIPN